ncbi:MAG: hypothetical protein ACPL4E_01045 [Thermoproteota archaeon]
MKAGSRRRVGLLGDNALFNRCGYCNHGGVAESPRPARVPTSLEAASSARLIKF